VPLFIVFQSVGDEVDHVARIDECEDNQAYDKMTKALEDPEIVKLKSKYHSKWNPLVVPDSFKPELWIVKVKVDLKRQT